MLVENRAERVISLRGANQFALDTASADGTSRTSKRRHAGAKLASGLRARRVDAREECVLPHHLETTTAALTEITGALEAAQQQYARLMQRLQRTEVAPR
jgi:hypothetical protein